MRSVLLRLICVLSLLAVTTDADALAFSNVYFFGDSTTDTGRNSPSMPPQSSLGLVSTYGYDPNRWTNSGGLLWADEFAAGLGFSASSRQFGGTNYAVGGSRTDELAAQITLFSTDVGGVADAGALYVIWSGGNDMLQGYSTAHAVSGVTAAINQLYALGAQNFLVADFYDVGPLAPGSGPLAPFRPIPPGASAWSSDYATALQMALTFISGPTIHWFDAKALLDPVIYDPVAHGFANGLALCVNDTLCRAGVGVDDYLMFDHVHLTAAGHSLVAEGALAAIPEPDSGLLVIAGLLGFAGFRRANA